ncbi:MAG: cupin domain-containing protein [Actinomycetota bacterium]
MKLWIIGPVLTIGVLAGCGDDGDEPEAVEDVSVEVLLDAEAETVLGQSISYPGGAPAVTMSIVTLEPGASTVNHIHEAPMAAYILEGEVTVDYGDGGTFTFSEGDALLEALDVVHEGTNTGSDPVRILVLNMGSDEVENTVTID